MNIRINSNVEIQSLLKSCTSILGKMQGMHRITKAQAHHGLTDLQSKVGKVQQLMIGNYIEAHPSNRKEANLINRQFKQIRKILQEVERADSKTSSGDIDRSLQSIQKSIGKFNQAAEKMSISSKPDIGDREDQSALKELLMGARLRGKDFFRNTLVALADTMMSHEDAALASTPGFKAYCISKLLMDNGLQVESEEWAEQFCKEAKETAAPDVRIVPLLKVLIEGGSASAKKLLINAFRWGGDDARGKGYVVFAFDVKWNEKPSRNIEKFVGGLEKILITLVPYLNKNEIDHIYRTFELMAVSKFKKTNHFEEFILALEGQKVYADKYIQGLQKLILRDHGGRFLEVYKKLLNDLDATIVILKLHFQIKQFLTPKEYLILDAAVIKWTQNIISNHKTKARDYLFMNGDLEYTYFQARQREAMAAPVEERYQILENVRQFNLVLSEAFTGLMRDFMKADGGDQDALQRLQELAQKEIIINNDSESIFWNPGKEITEILDARDYLTRLSKSKPAPKPLDTASIKVEEPIPQDVRALAASAERQVDKTDILLHIPFNQELHLADDISDKNPAHTELKKFEIKYNGYCELICNLLLIEDFLGRGDSPYSLIENITVETLNTEMIKSSHLLERSYLIEVIFASFFGVYPDNLFNVAEQKQLIIKDKKGDALNGNLILNKFIQIENGETLKMFVFNKLNRMEFVGHSLLIKKVSDQEYIFFDPNGGEFRNLNPDKLMQHLEEAKGSNSNILFMRGKDYLRRLQNAKIVKLAETRLLK